MASAESSVSNALAALLRQAEPAASSNAGSAITVTSPRGTARVQAADIRKYSEQSVVEAALLTQLYQRLTCSNPRDFGMSYGVFRDGNETARSNSQSSSIYTPTFLSTDRPSIDILQPAAVSLDIARGVEGIFNHYSMVNAGDASNGRLISSASWRKLMRDIGLVKVANPQSPTQLQRGSIGGAGSSLAINSAAEADLIYTRCVRGEAARYGILQYVGEEKGLSVATFAWALARVALWQAPRHLRRQCSSGSVLASSSSSVNLLVDAQDEAAVTLLLQNLMSILQPAHRLHAVGNGADLLTPDVVAVLQRGAGVLRTLFLSYALGSGAPDQHTDGASLPFHHLSKLCSDFRVCPGLVSKARLYSIFITVNPSRSPLLFTGLVEVIGRIALVGYSHPSLEADFPTPASKVEAVIDRIRACPLLTTLQEEEKSRGLTPGAAGTGASSVPGGPSASILTHFDSFRNGFSSSSNGMHDYPTSPSRLLGSDGSPGAGMRKLIKRSSFANAATGTGGGAGGVGSPASTAVSAPVLDHADHTAAVAAASDDGDVSGVAAALEHARSVAAAGDNHDAAASGTSEDAASAAQHDAATADVADVDAGRMTTYELLVDTASTPSSVAAAAAATATSITDVSFVAARRGGPLVAAALSPAAVAAAPESAAALHRGIHPPMVTSPTNNATSSSSGRAGSLPTPSSVAAQALVLAASARIQQQQTAALAASSAPSLQPAPLPASADVSQASSAVPSAAPSLVNSRASSPAAVPSAAHRNAGALPLPSALAVQLMQWSDPPRPMPAPYTSSSARRSVAPSGDHHHQYHEGVDVGFGRGSGGGGGGLGSARKARGNLAAPHPSSTRSAPASSHRDDTAPTVLLANRLGGLYGPFQQHDEHDLPTVTTSRLIAAGNDDAAAGHVADPRVLAQQVAMHAAGQLAGKRGFKRGFVIANSGGSGNATSRSSGVSTTRSAAAPASPSTLPGHVTSTLRANTFGIPIAIPVPLLAQTAAAGVVASAGLSRMSLAPLDHIHGTPGSSNTARNGTNTSSGVWAGRRGKGRLLSDRAGVQGKPLPRPPSKRPLGVMIDDRVLQALCDQFAPLLPKLKPIFLFYCRLGDPGNTGRYGGSIRRSGLVS